MFTTKRVSGDYNIYANLVTITGNLQVTGTQTTVNQTTLNQNQVITANLVVNGPMYAGGVPGSSGQLLTSNSNGVYWSSITGITANAAGSTNQIQYNSSNSLAGSSNFVYYAANGNVQIGTTFISNNNIISTSSGDLILNSAGTSKTYFKDILKIDYQSGVTPTNVSNTVQLLANTPGTGSSGLFVVNSNGSDELITKSKATVLALIFS